MADTLRVIDEGTIIEIVQGGDLTVVQAVQGGIEIEKLLFIQLSDTPNSYENAAGKTVTVNKDGTGLVFTKTYDSFLSLTDTPSKYDGGNKLVATNPAGTGLRFINYSPEDINIEYFTQLADVPSSYSGEAGKLLVVNENEDSLEFTTIETVIPDQVNVNAGSYTYPKIVVNKKGIITAVEEGKPFEFDPFIENRILIGDGTNVPAQLPVGKVNQYLMSPTGGNPVWNYIDKLISNGNTLVQAAPKSASDIGVLDIISGTSSVDIYPSNNQQLNLGNGGNLQLNGNIIIPNGKGINALGGLKIDPNSGSVGVTGITPDAYMTRIGDNDFVTKAWYEYQEEQHKDTSATYQRTPIEEITSDAVRLEIPNNSSLMEVYLQINSEFNEEAKLQIVDSYNQVLYDSTESPVLDYDNLRVSFNIPVVEDGFYIQATIVGYNNGQGQIFASYFKGNQ